MSVYTKEERKRKTQGSVNHPGLCFVVVVFCCCFNLSCMQTYCFREKRKKQTEGERERERERELELENSILQGLCLGSVKNLSNKRERERDRERETERETERERQRETERDTDTDRQTDREAACTQ